MENLTNALKNKALEKIKVKCRRRNIPDLVVDLLLAIVQQDYENINELMIKAVEDVGTKRGIPKQIIDISLQLAFPSALASEDLSQYATKKVLEVLVEQIQKSDKTPAELKAKLKHFSYGDVMKWLNAVTKMKARDFVGFRYSIMSLLNESKILATKFEKFKKFKPYLEILFSVLSETSFNEYATKLPEAIETLLDTMPNVEPIVKDGFKMMNMLLMSNGYDLHKEPEEIYDFFSNLAVTIAKYLPYDEKKEGVDDKKKLARKVSAVIYMVYQMVHRDLNELPEKFLKDLAQYFMIDSSQGAKIAEFAFRLFSFVFNAEYDKHTFSIKGGSEFDIDVEEIFEMIYVYPRLTEGELLDMQHNLIDWNDIYKQIASRFKMDPKVFTGFLNFILNKDED
jgi:hypothetical protein